MLQQFHLRGSALGHYEGSAERIRKDVLNELPQDARSIYPGNSGLFIKDPPPGKLPDYVVFVQLHSYEPVHKDADCSSLIVCWFADRLPENLPDFIAREIDSIDWNKFAKDGIY